MQFLDVLRWVEAFAFVVLAIIALRLWRRHRSEASVWLFATFATIGAISILGRVLPQPPDQAPDWVVKVILAVLLLFPYFLFRFMTALVSAPRWAHRVAASLTAGIIAWSLFLPSFPPPGADQPGYLRMWVLGLLIQWTALSFYVTYRLWRAGRGQPGVVKRRMRILGLGSAGLALALVVSGVASAPASVPVGITVALIGLVAAGLFLLGFAPPKFLRVSWRIPESERMRDAIGELMVADTAEGVGEILVPNAVRLVGGKAAALLDESGEVITFHSEDPGVSRDDLLPVSTDEPNPTLLTTKLRSGTLHVWASPFTPFFGGEEIALLQSTSQLADMALERVDLSAQERRFIADASHEMRTPLTAISGLTEMLASKYEQMPPETLEEVLEALNRQGARARSLIKNLLDMSRIGRGGGPQEREPVEIEEALRLALEAAPPTNGASVDVQVDGAGRVMASPVAVEQILVNLLTNAYTHGGNGVEVGATRQNGRVTIEVRDDGPGIPGDALPTLFDPFTRGRDAESPGSGLGLAISRRLARSHGGDLSYMDGQPKGSRFVLTLESA